MSYLRVTLSIVCLVAFGSASSASAQDAPDAGVAVVPETPVPASDPEVAALREAVAHLSAEVAALRAEQTAERADAPEADEPALETLLQAAEQDALPAFEPSLNLYGWSELGLQRAWGGLSDTGLVSSDGVTFLTRTNLYIDAYPAQNARVLTELRLGLYPDGSRDLDHNAIDTTVTDITSPYGGLALTKWSGIILERAHADWTPSDAFNLRAGLFLTPYGIWNVDHGAPTRITLTPPTFISFGLLPERQLGVEAFGTFAVLPWTLGYHLYVSNGRTFSANGRTSVANDPTDNKAVGGRFFLRTRKPYPLTLGMSAFTGNYDVLQSTLTVRPDRIERVETLAVSMQEYALAFDASADIGALRLRSELVLRWILYEDGHREITGPGTANADTLNFGAYAMAAYQLPWYGIEPLVMMEVMRMPTILGEGALVPAVGLNVYLSSTMTLRTQYSYAKMIDFGGPARELQQNYNHFLTARFIAAF